MYFVCDESSVVDLQIVKNKPFRFFLVGGVLLGYEAHQWWLKNYKKYPKKGKDFHDEKNILSILKELNNKKIKAIIHCVDLSIEKDKVLQRQLDLLDPLIDFAQNEPELRSKSLLNHIADLKRMEPATFVKTWTFLELLCDGLSFFLQEFSNYRSIDKRGIKMRIDDQVRSAIPSLKHFIYFMINRRALNKKFLINDTISKYLSSYITKHGENLYLNVLPLLDIKTDYQGDMDGRYPEVRLADFMCNWTNRALKGKFSEAISYELKRNIILIKPTHFNPDSEWIDQIIPDHARILFKEQLR
jgi:hypothetical protein